jgi:hypothetical protein
MYVLQLFATRRVINFSFIDARPNPKNTSGSPAQKKLLEPSHLLLPPSIAAWSAALSEVDTNPGNRVAKYSNFPNGLAFPDPALFVGVQTEAKQANYFANWIIHRSSLLFRVSMPNSASKPINNQLWRTLLNIPPGGASNDADGQSAETKNAKRIKIVMDVLSDCINGEDGVSINKDTDSRISWRGMEIIPGNVPPTNITREILWELCELNFRSELVALDQRAHVSPAMISPPTLDDRESLIGGCLFGGDSALLSVRIEDVNKGLADPLWSERRKYLLGLYRVMESWTGFRQYAMGRHAAILSSVSGNQDLSDEETKRLEKLVAGFYTQSFFNFFGRAPILPRCF